MRFITSILIVLVFSSSIVFSQELTTVNRNGFSIEFPSNWQEKKNAWESYLHYGI